MNQVKTPELMDRTHFQSLSEGARDLWRERLQNQWNVGLEDTVQFWFDDDRITGVLRYKRNSEGRHYESGGGAAVYLLGVSA